MVTSMDKLARFQTSLKSKGSKIQNLIKSSSERLAVTLKKTSIYLYCLSPNCNNSLLQCPSFSAIINLQFYRWLFMIQPINGQKLIWSAELFRKTKTLFEQIFKKIIKKRSNYNYINNCIWITQFSNLVKGSILRISQWISNLKSSTYLSKRPISITDNDIHRHYNSQAPLQNLCGIVFIDSSHLK